MYLDKLHISVHKNINETIQKYINENIDNTLQLTNNKLIKNLYPMNIIYHNHSKIFDFPEQYIIDIYVDKLSSYKYIDFEFVKNNYLLNWNWKSLSKNIYLTIEFIIANENLINKWDWCEITNNKNILYDYYVNTNLPWDKSILFTNNQITNIDYIKKNKNIWYEISKSSKFDYKIFNEIISHKNDLQYINWSNIPLHLFIDRNKLKFTNLIKWNMDYISSIPDLKIKYIIQHPNIKWNWNNISKFTKDINIILNDIPENINDNNSYDSCELLPYENISGLSNIISSYPWNFTLLSQNENLKINHIIYHREKPWNYINILHNKSIKIKDKIKYFFEKVYINTLSEYINNNNIDLLFNNDKYSWNYNLIIENNKLTLYNLLKLNNKFLKYSIEKLIQIYKNEVILSCINIKTNTYYNSLIEICKRKFIVNEEYKNLLIPKQIVGSIHFDDENAINYIDKYLLSRYFNPDLLKNNNILVSKYNKRLFFNLNINDYINKFSHFEKKQNIFNIINRNDFHWNKKCCITMLDIIIDNNIIIPDINKLFNSKKSNMNTYNFLYSRYKTNIYYNKENKQIIKNTNIYNKINNQYKLLKDIITLNQKNKLGCLSCCCYEINDINDYEIKNKEIFEFCKNEYYINNTSIINDKFDKIQKMYIDEELKPIHKYNLIFLTFYLFNDKIGKYDIYDLNTYIIEKYKYNYNIDNDFYNIKIDENFILNHFSLPWDKEKIFKNSNLTYEFTNRLLNIFEITDIDIKNLSKNKTLSKEIVSKNKNKYNWNFREIYKIPKFLKSISNKFIIENIEKFNNKTEKELYYYLYKVNILTNKYDIIKINNILFNI
jgi:hypothetical protein